MTRFQIRVLSILLAIGGTAVLPAGPLGTQLPTMTVRLRDYAEVPGPIQKEAVRVARKIFLAAGVATVWLDCGRGGLDGVRDDGCQQESGPTDIQLRILSRRQARRAGLSKDALGFAVIPPEGRGSIANAFSHRVEELARWTGVDRTLVLGYIMAHEVGHLLLNRSRHSKEGLMRAVWDQEDLKRPLSVGLAFSPTEARKMQANLLGWHQEQELTPLRNEWPDFAIRCSLQSCRRRATPAGRIPGCPWLNHGTGIRADVNFGAGPRPPREESRGGKRGRSRHNTGPYSLGLGGRTGFQGRTPFVCSLRQKTLSPARARAASVDMSLDAAR